MPEKGETEVFSNPLPPTSHIEYEDDPSAQPLTNDDFRKLMMTPRVSSSKGPKQTDSQDEQKTRSSEDPEDDAAEKRKKKKTYYAKLKKIEEERQKELSMKYRDRARERRDGGSTDYGDQSEMVSTTADYRAVAPDAKSGESYTERRKQIIQESKYLGGDMEHTHLVKGLDYALLDKVRAEITTKEEEQELEMEDVVTQAQEKLDKPPAEEEPEVQIPFKTRIGKNIYNAIFKGHELTRNELFIPGRMAYVVDLEDEHDESDIPTTLIRSKADCPSLEATTTLTTNDIVINKLTQILSYLRQGRRDKKLKKKDKGKAKDDDRMKLLDEGGIYGNIGDYDPMKAKEKERERENDRDRRDRGDRDRNRDRGDRDRRGHNRWDRERDHDRGRRDRGERDREHEKKKSYFEKPVDENETITKEDKPQTASELVKSINERFSKGWSAADIEREQNLDPGSLSGPITGSALPRVTTEQPTEEKREEERWKRLKNKVDFGAYAECYPGMMESADAIDDSDDEVDYTKMDQGNKKGPVGRWDFETQDEYSDYMASKEALPKAAFQYGVKMADGRKTRRTGPKDEKKELDREWQKIQNIISKRKQMGSDEGPYNKSAKF